jgi:division/cell wall cluster transcriptional repressor MraZ
VSDDAATSTSPMEPFFFGSYERALDDKGRFAVPFRFRRQDLAKEEEPPRFVIFEDPEGIVSMLTFDQYVRSMQQIMAMEADEERDEFLRWMADHSQEVPMDSQGRVAIPGAYLERIGVNKRVRVRGMVNRMELTRPIDQAAAEQASAAPPRKYFKRFFK